MIGVVERKLLVLNEAVNIKRYCCATFAPKTRVPHISFKPVPGYGLALVRTRVEPEI